MTLLCPACGGRAFDRVGDGAAWARLAAGSTDERRELLTAAAGVPELDCGDFMRCRACRMIRVERVPGAEALTRFYQAYYANRKYAPKQDKKIARATRRLARLRARGAQGRFLEVGCNLGFAVEAARRLGFEAHGIEIDAAATAQAQRLFADCSFRACAAAEEAASGRSYDVVFCTEVIEHVPDPGEFAAALGRLVAPGGHLFLTTPDAGHPLRGDFLAWPETKPPEHLFWFTRDALRRLLGKAGFVAFDFALNLKPGHKLTARKAPAA